jgi:D-alanyl-lipoteichoic acid acyltransferase DltB (MBOAT superfamily)
MLTLYKPLYPTQEFSTDYYALAKQYGNRPWYRHLAVFGALCNIFLMVIANTIGFVLGVDNTLIFLKQVFGTWQGSLFVIQACIGSFAAVQIMFEYR